MDRSVSDAVPAARTVIGRRPANVTTIWVTLVVATVAIAALAEQSIRGRWVVPLLILIAAFKVRLVFLHFMELAVTRPPWRYIFEAWIAICAVLVAGLYLYAPG